MKCKGIRRREIQPAVARREIEDFLIRRILAAGARGGVVGMSGGIDSSLVATLAASAFRRHSKGKSTGQRLTVTGLILPSATNRPEDAADAMAVARKFGINVRTIPIQPFIDRFVAELPDLLSEKYHRGNLASEVRALVLSRYAAANRLLVLGTGNRDEDYALGYFTKRGDGAVDISPIGDLSKRQVRQMAAYFKIPRQVITKPPTAGLWHGQTDENELGFTYDFAELVLAARDEGLDIACIAKRLGTTKIQVHKVLSRHHGSRHKMSMPEIAKVSCKLVRVHVASIAQGK